MKQQHIISVLDKQKSILIIVLVASFASFIALIYQTYLYYLEGYCGCTENSIFETYSVIWGIPVSLIGSIGVAITITFSLYFLSIFSRETSFSEKYNFHLARFWAIYQLISILIVFNMMYIAYILAHGFCELCSISQLAGIMNFILVMKFYSKIK